MVLLVKEIFIPMLTIVRSGDLWFNKVSISFLQQLNLKHLNKT